MIGGAGTERWYAVCCKPRQEVVAEENLLRQGFHVYFPRICVRKRRRGRWTDTVEALFPRYLFIRLDPSQKSTATVRSTRGAVGMVRFGGQPALVPEVVIDALRQREDAGAGMHRDERPLFSEGEIVRLVDGPLAGMEGIFAEQDGKKRVIILLELLGKANKIAMSSDWVTRAA